MRFLPVLVVMAILTGACDDGPTRPTPSVLTISTPSPAPGSTIALTLNGSQYFIARGSGALSIPITVTADREVPWAQLYVYLYDGGPGLGYCGQNLPDAPTWGPFPKGQTTTVTISGFQVSHSPCNVTSIKAFLHTRNSGLLTPPNESETVASGSVAVNYTLR
jgi:hypothetical protein